MTIDPLAPTAGIQTTISGNFMQFHADDARKILGFTMSGKLIELKPKTAEIITPLLQKARAAIVEGLARSPHEGFENSKGLLLVKQLDIII